MHYSYVWTVGVRCNIYLDIPAWLEYPIESLNVSSKNDGRCVNTWRNSRGISCCTILPPDRGRESFKRWAHSSITSRTRKLRVPWPVMRDQMRVSRSAIWGTMWKVANSTSQLRAISRNRRGGDPGRCPWRICRRSRSRWANRASPRTAPEACCTLFRANWSYLEAGTTTIDTCLWTWDQLTIFRILVQTSTITS